MRFLLLALALILMTEAVRAEDADTLTTDGVRYRLDGIDAPEMDQPCLDAFGEVFLCGQTAMEEVRKVVAARPIQRDDLGRDTSHRDTTRRIGRCSVDALDLHHWLVRQGWAVNFEPYARGRFRGDEGQARERGLGMWAGCFVAPRDFRYTRKKDAVLLGAACPPDARARLFPDDPRMPPGCEIKAKYARRALLTGHRGIYHVPGCGSYRRTTKPDRWFCSEEDARAAGFRASLTCALH